MLVAEDRQFDFSLPFPHRRRPARYWRRREVVKVIALRVRGRNVVDVRITIFNTRHELGVTARQPEERSVDREVAGPFAERGMSSDLVGHIIEPPRSRRP